jgi:hypothetical protein
MVIIYIVHDNFIIENSHHQYWKMCTLWLKQNSMRLSLQKTKGYSHSRLEAEKKMTVKRSYVPYEEKMTELHEAIS